MTNTSKDAKVAEIVGYRFIRIYDEDDDGVPRLMFICWPPDKKIHSDTTEYVSAKDIPDHYDWRNSGMLPLHFISAPTFATDGIVSDYMCSANAIPLRKKWWKAVGYLISERMEVSGWQDLEISDWLLERIPGDYAQALLAVEEASQ
ncbi:hypothetical protein LCGC14_2044990 [marine sediment metagenome]|uniref:Uncharacterized protein n=1 Tax=marine sediment metagenome TaxID=412755 RepID=A0A0F9EQN4_9ZZZZ